MNRETFPTFRQCTIILVLFGLVVAWINMNGYIATQLLLTTNTDTDTEKAINQCMKSHYPYQSQYTYQGLDSLHLLRLCQTRSRVTTQLPPTEDSTIKTKQPLQAGSTETSPTGGTKTKPTMRNE